MTEPRYEYAGLTGRALLDAIAGDIRRARTVRELHTIAEKANPHTARLKAWNEGWYNWLRENWKWRKNTLEGKYLTLKE